MGLRARRRGAYHAGHRPHAGLGRRVCLAGRQRHQLVGRSARGTGGGVDGALAGLGALEVPTGDQRAGVFVAFGLRSRSRRKPVRQLRLSSPRKRGPISPQTRHRDNRPLPWRERAVRFFSQTRRVRGSCVETNPSPHSVLRRRCGCPLPPGERVSTLALAARFVRAFAGTTECVATTSILSLFDLVCCYNPNTKIIVAFYWLRSSGTRDILFLAFRQRPEAIATYCLPSTE